MAAALSPLANCPGVACRCSQLDAYRQLENGNETLGFFYTYSGDVKLQTPTVLRAITTSTLLSGVMNRVCTCRVTFCSKRGTLICLADDLRSGKCPKTYPREP